MKFYLQLDEDRWCRAKLHTALISELQEESWSKKKSSHHNLIKGERESTKKKKRGFVFDIAVNIQKMYSFLFS